MVILSYMYNEIVQKWFKHWISDFFTEAVILLAPYERLLIIMSLSPTIKLSSEMLSFGGRSFLEIFVVEGKNVRSLEPSTTKHMVKERTNRTDWKISKFLTIFRSDSTIDVLYTYCKQNGRCRWELFNLQYLRIFGGSLPFSLLRWKNGYYDLRVVSTFLCKDMHLTNNKLYWTVFRKLRSTIVCE